MKVGSLCLEIIPGRFIDFDGGSPKNSRKFAMLSFEKYMENQVGTFILLHGTSHKFDNFDLSMAGERDYGDFGLGIYLTPSDGLAKMYAYAAAKANGLTPIIVKVSASITSPAFIDSPEINKKIFELAKVPENKVLTLWKSGDKKYHTRPKVDSMAIRNAVISLGYDAVVARNGKEIVVFDPSKIKILSYYSIDNFDEVPCWLAGVET